MTINAKIIADSVSQQGKRITTLQLRYPRFIHAEFMTHRMFSRNASSSRAIPVKKLIQDIIDDPVYPSYWGANQKGMQAGEEIDEDILWLPDRLTKEQAWDQARENAIEAAKVFDQAGYHKQIVNRLLEPYSHINVVVTATEWNNFFALRCHKDAQPEMRMLAEAIRDAMAASTPKLLNQGEWHLPYVDKVELSSYLPLDQFDDTALKISVARCARVSYLTQEGKTPTVEEDIALYERLLASAPLHASPAEHQATPDAQIKYWERNDVPPQYKWINPKQHKNFKGWIQYRATLPGENIEG